MPRLTLNDTLDRLMLLIRSGYPAIYIVSHEESRVFDYLAKIVRIIKHTEHSDKHLMRCYEGVGTEEVLSLEPAAPGKWLDMPGIPENANWKTQISHGNGNASHAALNAIREAIVATQPILADSITVFFDLHPCLRKDTIFTLVRPLRNTIEALRRYYDLNRKEPGKPYKTIIIVAPSAANLSPELDRDIIQIDFPLPETDELRLNLARMLPAEDALRLTGREGFGQGILSFPDALPQAAAELCGANTTLDDYRRRLCDLIAGAGRGLTLEDYKRGLNIFAVRGAKLCPDHVEDMLNLKAKAINNDALQYTPHIQIELGGLEGIKKWISVRRDAVISDSVRRRFHLPAPKGVMLCGASGGGKSQLAKLIAKEFNLALLRLDVGALFGMYVGESEERTRVALRLAEVLAPIVLWLDEVDKAFTGLAAGGDNGVSARVFGHFLTWLAEKEGSVFVVATANDFREMLTRFPEFSRKGRFDEIFWVDLPSQAARHEIFSIYLGPLVNPPADTVKLGITDADVDRLLAGQPAPAANAPQGDALDRFCRLLSEPRISANMTGAEIKYAVELALYTAHHEQSNLTPGMVLDAVKDVFGRCLYNPKSPDLTVFTQQLKPVAASKGWPSAESGGPV